MASIGKNIQFAAELLKKGKLVAIPTETVYGLAANALDTGAVASVFEAKNRPEFDPLIIHVWSVDMVNQYVKEFPNTLKKLADVFWPGPLTLLLKKQEIIPDLVTSGLDRVAVRVPNHPLTRELLMHLPFPLAAPSANPFGYISPTSPEHVNKQLGSKIEYILDGGICNIGIESTIVGLEEGKVCVYRLGGIEIEEIEKVVGEVILKTSTSSNPAAAGQLQSHYAPIKPLVIGDIGKSILLHNNPAVISFGEKLYKVKHQFNLSSTRNLKEAAANLFTALRQLDECSADVILCEELPELGLGRAINDRLRRAALK